MSSSTPVAVATVSLVLVGTGQVGQDLLHLIHQCRDQHARTLGLCIDVAALGDSSGFIASKSGRGTLSDDEIQSAIEWKKEGKQFRDHDLFSYANAEELLQLVNSSSVVVDTSASGNEALHQVLIRCLHEKHARVVFANKKPLTASFDTFSAFLHLQYRSRVGFESTVAAGTPVVSSFQRLLASGDKIRSFEGALSGSLGFISSGLEEGRLFSDIVKEAHGLGFTEPDPRDDLGGIDVARKALILARLAGLNVDMTHVSVEALYPDEFAEVDIREFMARLPELDQRFSERVTEATKKEQVLRYAAKASLRHTEAGLAGHISVGLLSVDRSSPLGQLNGTDNLLQVYTDVYADSPLVIRGSGAGARVTSSGVLADIVSTAFAMEP